MGDRKGSKNIFTGAGGHPYIISLDAGIGLWDVLGLELLLGQQGLREEACEGRVSLLQPSLGQGFT